MYIRCLFNIKPQQAAAKQMSDNMVTFVEVLPGAFSLIIDLVNLSFIYVVWDFVVFTVGQ
jgi:glycerol-3-phosphate responsive antiterminator